MKSNFKQISLKLYFVMELGLIIRFKVLFKTMNGICDYKNLRKITNFLLLQQYVNITGYQIDVWDALSKQIFYRN